MSLLGDKKETKNKIRNINGHWGAWARWAIIGPHVYSKAASVLRATSQPLKVY